MTVTVTAHGDGLEKAGVPISIRNINAIPTKVVTIINNTDKPIYPVFETQPGSTLQLPKPDGWLQAQFHETDVANNTFLHFHAYRVYIDPTSGVPAGATVKVTVPFYTKQVDNPDPTKPDQYVDWWNGMRVYIFDDKSSLDDFYSQDSKEPVTLKGSGITCDAGSSCGPLTTFVSHSMPNSNYAYQLTEYTFANVSFNLIPYPIQLGHVDYDISYVDQVYLSVAIEPVNNKQIGYTGTVENVSKFSSVIDNFVSNTGWATYVKTPAYPHKRVPGGYNLIHGDAGIEPDPSKAKLAIAALWDAQTGSDFKTGTIGNGCDSSDTDVCQVWKLFKANYAQDAARHCGNVPALTDQLMLDHIYGWAAFNTCGENRIIDTKGVGSVIDIKSAYQTKIQYSTNPAYNPYVNLVHGADNLDINVTYAFSIDDTHGNMNEAGDGIIIAVGGGTGLPNSKPFSVVPPVVHISLGTWPAGSGKPTFITYGVCSPYVSYPNRNNVINLSDSAHYPCEITLQDSKGKLYHFTIPKKPPLTTSDIVCGSGTKDPNSWCGRVQVDKNIPKNVSTPPPAA